MSLIKVRRIATLDGEDKRDGKDSIADKEREYTRLYELAQKNITFYAAKGDSTKVAEWKRKADEYKRLAQEAENAAEARNAKDSAAADADEDNYYLTAKKSIEDAGRLLASAVISLSRSKAPNAKEVHAELTRMSDMFERIRKRI